VQFFGIFSVGSTGKYSADALGLSVLVTLPKKCWPRVLGSVDIQLYSAECTPSVDRALVIQYNR